MSMKNPLPFIGHTFFCLNTPKEEKILSEIHFQVVRYYLYFFTFIMRAVKIELNYEITCYELLSINAVLYVIIGTYIHTEYTVFLQIYMYMQLYVCTLYRRPYDCTVMQLHVYIT